MRNKKRGKEDEACEMRGKFRESSQKIRVMNNGKNDKKNRGGRNRASGLMDEEKEK